MVLSRSLKHHCNPSYNEALKPMAKRQRTHLQVPGAKVNTKSATYATNCPPVIMSTFIVTRVARIDGGADSEMYTGLVTDAKPTPKPITRRPVHETELNQEAKLWHLSNTSRAGWLSGRQAVYCGIPSQGKAIKQVRLQSAHSDAFRGARGRPCHGLDHTVVMRNFSHVALECLLRDEGWNRNSLPAMRVPTP